MSRSLLTALGIVLVAGIAILVAKPDWLYKQISSSPSSAAVQAAPTGETTSYKVRLTSAALAQADPNSSDDVVSIDAEYDRPAADLKKMLFGEKEERSTLPLRNNPYLMIIVKQDNRIRYVRLTSLVREINLLSGTSLSASPVLKQGIVPLSPSSSGPVALKKLDVTPGGPVQYILWLDRPMDVQLEVKAAISAPGK